MLKVVLDTNVIVSAILSPGGNPALILNDVLSGKHLFHYAPAILAEYKEVLYRPELNFETKRVQLILESLAEKGIKKTPPQSSIVLVDESDRVFFDLANLVGAYLVTGNVKHYPDKPFIITPSQLMRLLQSE